MSRNPQPGTIASLVDEPQAGPAAPAEQPGTAVPPVALSASLVGAIADYLARRPWGEVNPILQQLQAELQAQGAT
jgi:hypothetical protein